MFAKSNKQEKQKATTLAEIDLLRTNMQSSVKKVNDDIAERLLALDFNEAAKTEMMTKGRIFLPVKVSEVSVEFFRQLKAADDFKQNCLKAGIEIGGFSSGYQGSCEVITASMCFSKAFFDEIFAEAKISNGEQQNTAVEMTPATARENAIK